MRICFILIILLICYILNLHLLFLLRCVISLTKSRRRVVLDLLNLVMCRGNTLRRSKIRIIFQLIILNIRLPLSMAALRLPRVLIFYWAANACLAWFDSISWTIPSVFGNSMRWTANITTIRFLLRPGTNTRCGPRQFTLYDRRELLLK